MMKLIGYLTFVLFSFNVLFTIQAVEEKMRPISQTHVALEPVFHLVNSKLYLQEDNESRSRSELEVAFSKIENLRDRLPDTPSQELIDVVLPDLRKLRDESSAEWSIKTVNEVYVKMLLALSYVQVRHAMRSFEAEQPEEMELALRRGMLIIKKALILSEGSKKDHEVRIYAEMNKIAKASLEDQNQTRNTLQRVLREIEGLEVSFSK